MKFARALIIFIGIILLGSNAFASPCGKSGMTVVKAFSGNAFVIYSFRKGPDIAFQLPGKEISFPNGISGPKVFNIDGVAFETLFASTDSFVREKGLSDLEILKRHRVYEVEYIKKSPGPLTQFIELGPRERRAGGKQPPFTFYLWQMVSPTSPNSAKQYYLTTVSGGEVVVLTAIVSDSSKDPFAMSAFESYASSFQHILRKEECPESK